MRAHYLSQLDIQDEYRLIGDSLHHLVNVIRIQEGDELLLLNGKGLKVKTRVTTIAKRELTLKFLNLEAPLKSMELDLALGMPKKEALELCLKEAVELGIRNIFLIKSEYSQMKFLEDERLESLLISALEQSNADTFPVVKKMRWEDLPWNEYSSALLMDSQIENSSLLDKNSYLRGPNLLIVGPEGGFSPAERTFLHSQKNVKILKLPTPILRTPTALATGVGFLWQALLD